MFAQSTLISYHTDAFVKTEVVCTAHPKNAMSNSNTLYVNSEKLSGEAEELAMITVQLASKFLFSSGLHTKKSLRGPAHEWYELLTLHLRYSKAARAWFCQEALFDHPSRYLKVIYTS